MYTTPTVQSPATPTRGRTCPAFAYKRGRQRGDSATRVAPSSQGANVVVGAITTSRSSGCSRPASVGIASSSAASSSSWVVTRWAGQPKPRAMRGDLDLAEAGPRAVLAGSLREPVHDRVAAVREDHVEHAGAVVRGAPEPLDRRRATSRRRSPRRRAGRAAPCAARPRRARRSRGRPWRR